MHHAIAYSIIIFSATSVSTYASSLDVAPEVTKMPYFPSLQQIELSERHFQAAEAARHALVPAGISFWPYFLLTLILVMFVALVISVFLAAIISRQDTGRSVRVNADAKIAESARAVPQTSAAPQASTRRQASVPSPPNNGAGPGSGMPLCDKLRVPVGHHLDVKFPDAPTAQRQSVHFGVVSIEGVSLFHISISELGDSQGMQLEKLNGEKLASLSTEPLWQTKEVFNGLELYYKWGAHYATLMPLKDGRYQVVRQGRVILSFTGSSTGQFPQDPCLGSSQILALDESLEVAAHIRMTDNNQLFHVSVYSAQDAGLVVLSFLGILKMRKCL